MRGLVLAVLLLIGAGGAQAQATRAVCFIGPVFLAGVADGRCVGTERERRRLFDTAVVDAERKPIPLLMRADGKSKKTMTVATCKAWLRAVSMSSFAMRAVDRGREAFYQRTCQTLDLLKFAGPSKAVYLAPYGRDLLKPDVVPTRLLEQAGIKGPLPLPGATVGDLVKAGEIIPRDAKTGMMEVRWRTVDLSLNPAARGDFDRDGIEDLAIAMNVVMRGSGRGGIMMVLLTRRKKGGVLEVIYPKARG